MTSLAAVYPFTTLQERPRVATTQPSFQPVQQVVSSFVISNELKEYISVVVFVAVIVKMFSDIVERSLKQVMS